MRRKPLASVVALALLAGGIASCGAASASAKTPISAKTSTSGTLRRSWNVEDRRAGVDHRLQLE